MVKISGLYKITNQENGKFYIGSSKKIQNRWNQHLCALRKRNHHNSMLMSDFIKYGEEKFQFSILEEINDEKKLIEREQFYLDLYWDNQQDCYNSRIKADSNRGCKRTEDFKQKISIKYKERGYKPSQQCIEASIKSRRENGITDEARKILSAAAKKRRENKSTNEKILAGINKYWNKPENREAHSRLKSNPRPERRKKIAQCDLNGNLIKIFDNVHDAAKATGLHFGSIKKVIYGERSSANGFKWGYV